MSVATDIVEWKASTGIIGRKGVQMAQKVKILGFKVTGRPFLGTDSDGVPSLSGDGVTVATWLADASRARFNQCRSIRSKYVYADGERVLNSDGTTSLVPIGNTVTDISHAQARTQFDFIAAVPAMVLHYQQRMETQSWFAAAKRRSTNVAAKRPAGAMPGFSSRRRVPLTFGVFANNGSATMVTFVRTGKQSGVVSFGGQNPKAHTAAGYGQRWSMQIRVRYTQPIHPFTSVHINVDSGELVFSSPVPLKPHARTGAIVGLDLGAVVDIATSDGAMHARPNTGLLISELKQAQRAMARSKETAKTEHRNFWESNRYQVRKSRAANLYARIARINEDWRHKTTTALVNSHDVIVIEDLKVANMTRKGRGKRGLNRVIAAASPASVRAMLEYKAFAAGVTLIAVPAHYTSQRCHKCGHIEAENRESQAVFICRNNRCGWHGNADYNAAQNILDRGIGTWDGTRPKRVRPHKTMNAPAYTAQAARPRQPPLSATRH